VNPGDTCTPIYELPYPTGNSNPCLVGDTGCDFAAAVETRLNELDAITARLQGVPFAYASNIAEMQYNNALPGSFVPFFDTTMADTDGMIDLASDPTILTCRTAGVYSIFLELDISIPLTGTGLSLQMNINTASGSGTDGTNWSMLRIPSSPSMPLRTDQGRVANTAFGVEYIAPLQVGYTINTTLFVSGPTGLVSFIQVYRMGAVWLRESL
jgi:hypothetical protein